MNELEQLKAENARLKLQLGKVLEAIKNTSSDSPCPSTAGLNDYCSDGRVFITCYECWQKALDEV